MLTARRRPAFVDGEPVDVGQVGDVVAVDPSTVHALLDAGRIPVVATVARGLDGCRTTSTPTPPPRRSRWASKPRS